MLSLLQNHNSTECLLYWCNLLTSSICIPVELYIWCCVSSVSYWCTADFYFPQIIIPHTPWCTLDVILYQTTLFRSQEVTTTTTKGKISKNIICLVSLQHQIQQQVLRKFLKTTLYDFSELDILTKHTQQLNIVVFDQTKVDEITLELFCQTTITVRPPVAYDIKLSNFN